MTLHLLLSVFSVWECRKVSQWTVLRNIILKRWIPAPRPWHKLHCYADYQHWFMTSTPSQKSCWWHHSHTPTDTRTPVPLRLWKNYFYKWSHSLTATLRCVWNSSFHLALSQGVAKQYFICKVNETGLTIWYGRLTMGIYSMLAADQLVGGWGILAGRWMTFFKPDTSFEAHCKDMVELQVITFWM